MEQLEGAAAVGGADGDAAAVAEVGFFGQEDFFPAGRGVVLLDEFAYGGEVAVKRGGVVGEVVEMVEGKADFFEFFGGVRQGAVYNACFEMGGEEAAVEDAQGDVGGKAELAGFEDEVAAGGVVVEVPLLCVGGEAADRSVFVEDVVEVVETQERVREESLHDGLLFGADLRDVHFARYYTARGGSVPLRRGVVVLCGRVR